MLRKIAGWMMPVLAAGWLLASPASAAVDKAALDGAFAALPKYDWGQSRQALDVIDDAVVATYGQPAARKDLERRLDAVLKNPSATRAAKQYVCRKLAIIGTAASVDALAALLGDEKLSHMGRYALERMPCAEAGAALRDAIAKTSGKLKVGMINSVGMRADAKATGQLIALLKSPDKAVASAAAAALGRIGADEAAGPLADFLAQAKAKDVKLAAYDAILDFAGRQAAKGNKDAAARIYRKLYEPRQPSRIRRAALHGLAMAQPAETAPLILEALGSADVAFRGVAAQMIRQMPGSEATRTFAAALAKLGKTGKIAMIQALADRKDPAARDAVAAQVSSSDADVSVAAVNALGSLGGSRDVALLAKLAAGGGPAAKSAAASLAKLPGKDVNDTIVSSLASADAKVKAVLINSLAARSAADKAAVVQKYVTSADPQVRAAAINAVAALGDETQLGALIAVLKSPQGAKDSAAIDKAISAICTRSGQKAAAQVLAGMKGAGAEAKVVLLHALGRCGGPDAFQAVVAATKSTDTKVADAAIRVLAAWQDKAAIGPLMTIAQTTGNRVYKVLAIRGLVGLARRKDVPTKEKWTVLSKAMELATATSEKRAILGALADVRTMDAFRLVAKYVDQKNLAEEAAAAAVNIAKNVWKQDKAFVRDTLQTAQKNVRNSRTKRDIKRVLGSIK
ncbi:MAG: HEAT repeat domain-containing protein [Planctomycetes bacterium]|nr:HEAT repeat domain-containing protein [Planctomycetota bacterium]